MNTNWRIMAEEYCINCNCNCLDDIEKSNDNRSVKLFSVDNETLEDALCVKISVNDVNSGQSFLCTPCGTLFFEFYTAKTKFKQRCNPSSKIAHITALQGSNQPDPNSETKTADLIKTETAEYVADGSESDFPQSTVSSDFESYIVLCGNYLVDSSNESNNLASDIPNCANNVAKQKSVESGNIIEVNSSVVQENTSCRRPIPTKYSECDETTSSKIDSGSHRGLTTIPQPSHSQFRDVFQCPYSYCAKKFNTNCTFSGFVGHIKRHEIFIVNKETKVGKRISQFYNEEDKSYSCPKCADTFKTQTGYFHHFERQDHVCKFKVVFLESEKSKTNFAFQCPKCPKSYPTKLLLQQNCGMYHAVCKKMSNEVKAKLINKTLPNKRFSHEEDAKLKSLVLPFGENNWKDIAKKFPGRSAIQCEARWTRIQTVNETIRCRWTKEEDDKIAELMAKYGPCKWDLIFKQHWTVVSALLPGRTAPSAQGRWNLIRRKMISR